MVARRLLIAVEENGLRSRLSEGLSAYGYACAEASDPRGALHVLGDGEPLGAILVSARHAAAVLQGTGVSRRAIPALIVGASPAARGIAVPEDVTVEHIVLVLNQVLPQPAPGAAASAAGTIANRKRAG